MNITEMIIKKIILTIPLFLFYTCIYPQSMISPDSAIHYQTMTGWEATCFVAVPDDPAFVNYKDTLLWQTVNDLGINRIRLEVRSGVENDTDHYAIFAANGFPEPPDQEYYDWRYNRYANVNDNADTSVNWSGFHFTELDWNIGNIVIPMKDLAAANDEELYIKSLLCGFYRPDTGRGIYS